MNTSVKTYLNLIAARTETYGVKLVVSPDKRVPYACSPDMMVSGYFVDRPRVELAVAQGKPTDEWLSILVHEKCHMDQWIEQSSAWTEVFVNDKEAVDWIDLWIKGEDTLPLPIEDLIARARTVELDCEYRAVLDMRKHNLPLNIEEYIQKANSYVYYYNHMLKNRQWYGDVAPYEKVEVWSKAPKTLDRNLTETPVELAEAFEQYFPKEHTKT